MAKSSAYSQWKGAVRKTQSQANLAGGATTAQADQLATHVRVHAAELDVDLNDPEVARIFAIAVSHAIAACGTARPPQGLMAFHVGALLNVHPESVRK
jgi:outer membrane murein-binding lipoprotein Lpp